VISQEQVQEERLGNFGADPKPPSRGSNIARRRSAASPHSTSAGLRACPWAIDGPSGSSRRRDRVREGVRLADDIVTPRVPASITASSTWRNDGSPWRARSGKYVPARNGSPSGVANTLIGQPPRPVGSLHRLHVDRVDVRPLLPVDLHAHEMPVHHLRGSPGPRTTRDP